MDRTSQSSSEWNSAIQAGLPPNPTIGYEGDTMGTAVGPGYQGGFVEQKIIVANKLQLARAAATMDLRNAELALVRAQTDLATRVRGAYFAVLVAKESIKLNRALVKFEDDKIRRAILLAAESVGGFGQDFLPGVNDRIFDT